jgi:hypothetical protein
MNFPKSPLVEHCVRRPGFSLEKNGFTRVNTEGGTISPHGATPAQRRASEHPFTLRLHRRDETSGEARQLEVEAGQR